MSAVIRNFLFFLVLAAPLSRAADHVIVTGGPALRVWEDLRVETDRHDRWWGNFVRASTLRMVEIREAYGRDAHLVWMIYKPGYVTRGREDGKPYVQWLAKLARERNATLIWFEDSGGFIRALNSRPRGAILTFDFFGHSNKYCFMFDYGNDIMAASTAWFHERDIPRIKSSVFDRNAYCKSWGCHTGESMSAVWKRRLGIPLEGARGPTSYVMVGRGEMPSVSGTWER